MRNEDENLWFHKIKKMLGCNHNNLLKLLSRLARILNKRI
jgi:hypothetical protein